VPVLYSGSRYDSHESGFSMGAVLARVVRRTWIGLAGVLLSIVAAVAYTSLRGPLWGEFEWRVIAMSLMVAGFFGLIAIEEFFRAPNPYTRVHPMFGYQDLGPAGDLQSSDASLFWAAGPMLAGAGIILLTFWLF
jgi:hypothetical protein